MQSRAGQGGELAANQKDQQPFSRTESKIK